ncbi:MAG TPA: response regulator [Pyrinomonadaceae bacterium]|nr:response regulator [Pyrinomonadaceae bacterium]
MSAVRQPPRRDEHHAHEATLRTNLARRKGVTILLAEDDEDNRDILRTLLDIRGFDVVEAADGQQAVELARTARPDLILMDLKMPVLNGLAAARAIRLRPEPHLRAVPIVALSAYHPSQHGAVAFAAGCDDYVLKPINHEQLERVIEKLLQRAAGRDAPEPLGDTLTA